MELTGGAIVLLVFAVLVGSALAIAGIVRPFFGLMVVLCLHFMQPGELFTPLAYLRPELLYGVLVLASYLLRHGSGPRGPVRRPRTTSAAGRDSSRAKPIVTATALLVGAAALSIPLSVWRGGAAGATIELAKLAILLFLMSRLIDTESRLRWVVRLMVGFLIWFAGTGAYIYLKGDYVVREGVDRAVGITSLVGGPNELAGLVLALLPFVAVLFLCTSSLFLRCVLLGVVGLGLGTVVVTASRVSVFALGAMVIYYLLRSRHAIPGFLLLCIAASVTWLVLPTQYKQRYLTIGDYAVGGQLDASNELRIRIWKAGLVMFLEHPIVGVGPGQFPTAYGMSLTRHEAWMNPHNLLLQIACELGIVGLFAFGYFLSRLLKANRYVLSLRDDPDLGFNYQVAVACGAMLIGVLVLSCVSHTLYRPYWYSMGGLIAANCAIAETIRQSQAVKVEEEAEVPSPQWLGRRPARSRHRITRPSWVS